MDQGIFAPFQDLNLNHNAGSKEDIFDNFLADLFTNNLNLDLKNMGLTSGDKHANMPLDKSLLMTTAKKQSLEMILMSESAGLVGSGGAFSHL